MVEKLSISSILFIIFRSQMMYVSDTHSASHIFDLLLVILFIIKHLSKNFHAQLQKINRTELPI